MSKQFTPRNLADIWEDVADRLGDAPALIAGEKVTTWAEFDDRAARLGAALQAAGIKPGTKVAINLYNCSEWLETFFALVKIRAVPANVNYRYLDDELVYLLSDAKAEVLFFHASLGERIAPLAAKLPNLKLLVQVNDGSGSGLVEGASAYEDLIASHEPTSRIFRPLSDEYLSYTGGTTGLPKGVMVSLSRLGGAMPMLGPMLGLTEDEVSDPVETAAQRAVKGQSLVALPASPLMHSVGFAMTALPTLLYGGVVVTLTERSFNAHEACQAVERHGVHLMSLVGDAIAWPVLAALDERAAEGAPYDMSSLRLLSSAGVAWSGRSKQALFEHMPTANFFDACGASEGVVYGMKIYRKGAETSGTNFTPIPGLKFLSETGEWIDAAPGVFGLMANLTASSGYYNDPEKTAQTFFSLGDQTYCRPGDFGRIEADGSLTLVGRSSSTINTGGEKVHAEEVEDVIREMAIVEDCLVFGMPDERFGQRVTALVKLWNDGGFDCEEIRTHVREHLAHYKAPKDVLMIGQIPRGPNGKPDFRAARAFAKDQLENS